MTMMQTNLAEHIRRRVSYEDWVNHDAAFMAAKERGACFDCATRIGFAVTDKPKTTPVLCARCVRLGVLAMPLQQ
jgi:hypothetical protein